MLMLPCGRDILLARLLLCAYKMTSESLLRSERVVEEIRSHESSISDSVLGWLSPRISFSSSFTGLDIEVPAQREECFTSPNFEFSMSFSSGDFLSEQFMLTADELFNNGKLLPLPVASQNITSAEHPSLCENEDTKGFTMLACQHKDTSHEASLMYTSIASSAISTPSELSSSSISHFSGRRTPQSVRHWNTLRNLFRLKTDEKRFPKGGLIRFAGAFKFWNFFVRKQPQWRNAHANNLRTDDFSGDFCLTTSHSDTVRAKSSQARVSLSMPYRASCCSFPSVNELDEEPSIDECVNCEGIEKSMKNPEEKANTIKSNTESSLNIRRWYSSKNCISLPSTRMNSPERCFEKECFPQKGFDDIYSTNSVFSDSNRLAFTKLRRCKSNPKGLTMPHNQENPPKIKGQSKLFHGKASYNDWKPCSEKKIAYPSGVRVTPILNVPACLSSSLQTVHFNGNVVSIKVPSSKKMSRIH